MADILYETNWHELPIELQKYFVYMIQSAQHPYYYHGSGVAILNLQTFTDVSWDFTIHEPIVQNEDGCMIEVQLK